jgi:cytochrome aa3-600 menaquinol oxidase subunit 2
VQEERRGTNVNLKQLLSRGKWVVTLALAAFALTGCNSQYMVLNPQGPVGRTEYNLIIFSTILVTIVVIPVIAILVYIVYRYRDKPDNKAPYMPHWEDSKVMEIIWWAIPIVIIGILGTYTVKDTYALTKPPASNAKPLTIQVTSLNWKWLFQYPGQNIATVNEVVIPAGVPIQFELTADAPMNSFWIPQLGGQEYTMPGMAMRLWLQADKTGEYFGTGASFTGEGFAHMSFPVKAVTQADFDTWVKDVKNKAPVLTKDGYAKLTEPGTMTAQEYSSYPKGLFEEVVNKDGGQYMNMQGMNMQKQQSESDKKKNNMSGMSNMSDMSNMNIGH